MTHDEVDDELQSMLDEAHAMHEAGQISAATLLVDIEAARRWAARAHDKADDLELTDCDEECE